VAGGADEGAGREERPVLGQLLPGLVGLAGRLHQERDDGQDHGGGDFDPFHTRPPFLLTRRGTLPRREGLMDRLLRMVGWGLIAALLLGAAGGEEAARAELRRLGYAVDDEGLRRAV